MESAVISLFICNRAYEYYDRQAKGIYQLIFAVLLVQTFFVLLSMLVPEFRDWVLSNSRQEGLVELSNQFGILRSFGLTEAFTSTTPMLLGLSSALIFYQAFSQRFSYRNIFMIFCCALFVLSAAVNARIGLVPIILSFMILTASFFYNQRIFFKWFSISLFLSSIGFWLFTIYSDAAILKRLLSAKEEILALFELQLSGTFLTLYKMHFLPADALGVLTGTGIDVFRSGTLHSDVGYIVDINLIGILGSIILWSGFMFLLLPALKSIKSYFGLNAVILTCFSLFLFYFKGASIAANDLTKCIMLLSFYFVMVRSNIRDKRN
jgi:hypothetical protein